jgi:hypothetical protein
MGGIRSGTHLAEADWITHSFDVFFEKKPACRLTDKMFMNHRNTVNMAGLWQKDLPPGLEQKICDAICECRKKFAPTVTQLSQAAQDTMEAVRGVYDTTREESSAPNETHRRQACFAAQFNKSGMPWSGATPSDPQVLTEVPYRIPNELIMSETGRTTSVGGPTAPGSVQRALNQARGNPGTVVIWDMVVLNNPAAPATWDNVKKVLEVKFKGDKFTDNQFRALEHEKVRSKVERVDEADCRCDEREEEERERQNERIKDAIKKGGETMKKLLPLLPLPGPKGFPGGFGAPIPVR